MCTMVKEHRHKQKLLRCLYWQKIYSLSTTFSLEVKKKLKANSFRILVYIMMEYHIKKQRK